MKRWFEESILCLAAMACVIGPADTAQAQRRLRGPQPGDIFREYTKSMLLYADWRVIDPKAPNATAQTYLPNAVLGISIADLQKATRAEVLIDLWGGHAGTTGKGIRFNYNSWIPVPELATPGGSPECYNSYANIVVDVPLADLVEGDNTFEGTNTGQTCNNFGWGQYGQNGIVLRVYYDSTKAHPTGSITSIADGGTLSDNPVITANATGTAGIAKVDFVGYYEGLDTDGDGVYLDWQYNWHRRHSESVMLLHDNIGSATSAPYQVTWNTDLVPDQALGGIQLSAYVRDNNGMCYMTPAVKNLSLMRGGISVKMYTAYNVPQVFEVWGGGGPTKTCNFDIPVGTRLADATAATMLVSTWDGLDGLAHPGENHWTKVNSWTVPHEYGEDHFVSLDWIQVPTSAFVEGTNTFLIHSESSASGIDVNWPGPHFVVKYVGNYGSPAPEQPALASPPNNNTSQPLSLTIKWRKALTATSYRLQVSRDAPFSSIVVDDSSVTDTAKAVSGLSPFTKYYWRVRAKNAVTTSAFSAAWNFTTFVSVPTPISPANNATGQPTNVTLKWNKVAGATKYYVQLAVDSTLAGGFLVDDSTLTDSIRTAIGLTYDMQYFWRVAGKTGSSFGPSSGTVNFWTLIPAPGQVTLASPNADGTVTADSTTFTWRRQAGATKYWFQLGFDSLFVFKSVDSTLTGTLKVVQGLTNNHTYFWEVRAGNGGGWGSYSTTRRLNTLFTGIDDKRSLPTEFRLHDNYPNPFNPSTRVDYELPKESHVSLTVYNMLGEIIARLVDDVKPAGYYSVNFDASGLASGVYFYRLNAGDVTLLKKMMLVK